MKKNTQYLLPVLLGIIFLHSFFISKKYYDGINEPKTFAFYFLSGGFIIYYCLKRLFTSKPGNFVKLNLPDLLFLLYYLYIFTRVLIDKDIRFLNNQFVALTICYFLYLIVKSELSPAMDSGSPGFVYFFVILSAFAIIHCFIGILQFIGVIKNWNDYFRMGGTYGNPSPYSNLISAIIPVGIAGLLLSDRKKFKYAYFVFLISFFLSLIVLVLSNARTSWLAAAFSLFIVLWYRYSLQIKFKAIFNSFLKKFSFALILIFSLLFVSYQLYNYKKDSAFGRVFIWKISSGIVRDHPLFGVGFEKYYAAHNDAKSKYFNDNPAKNIQEERITDDVPFAFNEFLQIAVESGIIGLAIFGTGVVLLLFVKFPASGQFKTEKGFLYVAAKSCFISILISALFSYPFRQWSTLALFFICGGILSGYVDRPIINFRAAKLIRAFYFFVLLCSVWFMIIQKDKRDAFRIWAQAATLSKKGQYPIARQMYEKVYPVLNYYPQFMLDYGNESYFMGDFKKSIELLEKVKPVINNSEEYISMGSSYQALKQYNLAEESYLHALTLVPYKIYPRYKLALLYKESGQKEKAVKLAREILQFNPKVYHPNIDIIKVEMARLLDEYDVE